MKIPVGYYKMKCVGFGRVAFNCFIEKNVNGFITLPEYYFRENCTIRTNDIFWLCRFLMCPIFCSF